MRVLSESGFSLAFFGMNESLVQRLLCLLKVGSGLFKRKMGLDREGV